MDGARARFWAGLGGARRNDLARLPGWEARLAAALDEPAHAVGPRLDRARRLRGRAGRAAERRRRGGRRALVGSSARRRSLSRLRVRARRRRRAGSLRARCTVKRSRASRSRFERPGLPADDLIQLLRAKLFTMPGDGARRAGRPPADRDVHRPGVPAELGARHRDAHLHRLRPHPRRSARGPDAQRAGRRAAGTEGRPGAAAAEARAHDALQGVVRRGGRGAGQRGPPAAEAAPGRTADDRSARRAVPPAPRVGGAPDREGARCAAGRDAHRAGAAPRLPPERLASVLELVASRLEASIERLLA